MQRNPFQRLTVALVVNRLPAFNGIRRFAAAFTAALHRSLVLDMMIKVHVFTFYFRKLHFTIIFPSMPRSFN
jgi:hypothetical protein